MSGGMAALAAIQAALLKTALRGGGQYIDVSLLDGMLNLLVWECQEAQFPDTSRRRHYRPFSTLDGYVSIAPTSQKTFEELCHAVQHPGWITDERFCDKRIREEHYSVLGELVEAWTKTKTSQKCEELLLAEERLAR
jgi:crotonobetainyl-CoA:carnitine CoA-transferase CaiB-like acyl-CoA transferase